MAKKPLVVANWKMYIESPTEARAFVAGLRRKLKTISGVEVWLAAPAPLVPLLAKSGSIKVGAQALSAESGAHTGGVSAAMLKGVGAQFVIIGHSERRAAGETNADTHAQLAAAAGAGLAPLLCVGELERPSTTLGAGNQADPFSYIEEQLATALRGAQSLVSKLVVAYEPVWAIGKHAADAMQPEQVEETVIFIRKTLADILGRKDALKVAILYGGSVEAANAAALLREGGVGGFLVGHASAELDSFVEILKTCQK